jgi:serine phosphatase RsbU (regulator of sigma subunit)
MISPPVELEIRCLEVWGGTEAVDRTLSVPGIDAWIFAEPYAGHPSGGDIHYVSSCFTGRVARFAIADVAGHGDHASDLAVTLRGLMKKHINFLDQTGLARVLNQEFSELSQEGRFATALLVSYFAPTDHLVLCNAGHPRPLWYRAADREWQWLDDESPGTTAAPNNLPLGLIDPTSYIQFSVKLAEQDLVLLYTDWLVEAESEAGRPLGEEGLLKIVRELTESEGSDIDPRVMGSRLLSSVRQFRGERPFDDDRTLMFLRHNGSPVPRRPVRGAIRAVASLLGLAGD